MRWPRRLALAAAAFLALPAAAQGPAVPDRTGPPWPTTGAPLLGVGEVQVRAAAGGMAWRVGTTRGAVLAWRPPGYQRRRAGVVVYLHGYYVTVDQAVGEHRLLEQFRESGRNALFLVAETPAWNGEAPVWDAFGDLLAEVTRRTGLTAPGGPVVVVAHSGGYRTLLGWLGEPRLAGIVLLDGLYRGEEALRAWLDGPGPGRRLLLAGDETAERAEALAAQVPGAVVLPAVPAGARALERAAGRARLLVLRSQHDHMAMVEGGEVLPLLLGAAPLGRVR
jgi:hypothetical protein